MIRFYMGAKPHFIQHTDVPLFVSDRHLKKMLRLPEARGPVAVDSGGFTELSREGGWHNGATPRQYVDRINRYAAEIGIDWAAPQDWMCEPDMLARTGLTVTEHQRRTVGNYLDLKAADDTAPIIPVIQGWSLADYDRCVVMYEQAGVDLTVLPVVGIGSVCRRQATREAAALVYCLTQITGLRLHGFGFKVDGLREVAHLFVSADSMAWSAAGRREPEGCYFRLPRSRGPHRNEANCLRYALAWRRDVLDACGTQQLTLGVAA